MLRRDCISLVFCHAGVINMWERMPYISDTGLVRNFTKSPFNTTTEMPSPQQFREGFYPAFDRAPAGVGSAVSPFRRIHKNILMANYNALAAVLMDDGSSRALMYDNYFVYGQWGVGERCVLVLTLPVPTRARVCIAL
jgi:hypothetical protein